MAEKRGSRWTVTVHQHSVQLHPWVLNAVRRSARSRFHAWPSLGIRIPLIRFQVCKHLRERASHRKHTHHIPDEIPQMDEFARHPVSSVWHAYLGVGNTQLRTWGRPRFTGRSAVPFGSLQSSKIGRNVEPRGIRWIVGLFGRRYL